MVNGGDGTLIQSNATTPLFLSGLSGASGISLASIAAGTTVPHRFYVSIITGSTSATFTLVWSQSTSNTTGVNVKKGSVLTMWKRATV